MQNKQLKDFLEESKFNVEKLSMPSESRQFAKKGKFSNKQMELQGMSIMEANLSMPPDKS